MLNPSELRLTFPMRSACRWGLALLSRGFCSTFLVTLLSLLCLIPGLLPEAWPEGSLSEESETLRTEEGERVSKVRGSTHHALLTGPETPESAFFTVDGSQLRNAVAPTGEELFTLNLSLSEPLRTPKLAPSLPPYSDLHSSLDTLGFWSSDISPPTA